MPMMRMLGALALVGLTLVLLAPACDLLHRCGCTWPWAGADAHCNVHALEGPHCPWCEHHSLGAAAALGILAGQRLVFRAARRRGAAFGLAGAVAVAALPLLTPAVGALLWLPTDYPHFLARDARAGLGLPDGPIRCVVRRPAPPLRAGER